MHDIAVMLPQQNRK